MASSAPLVPGDLVLVTGATGLIGTHAVKEALQVGLRVRGAARTEAKAAKLRAYFCPLFGDRFQTVLVPDGAAPNAYAEAMEGVQGVVHVAHNMVWGSEWKFVEDAVAAMEQVLNAAEAAKTVRRVIVTGSAITASFPNWDQPKAVTEDDWNDEGLALARQPGAAPGLLYVASKYLVEKKAWEYAKSHATGFGVSTVLPVSVWGETLPANSSEETTATAVPQLAQGNPSPFAKTGALPLVSATNAAQVHIALLISPEAGERVIAWGQTGYSLRDVIHLILKLQPDAPLSKVDWSSFPLLDQRDHLQFDPKRMHQLLQGKKIHGLEDMVKKALSPCN